MAKGTNTTRRSVLAGLAVLPGATAMAGGVPVGSLNVLPDLIGAHRKAHAHLDASVAERDRIDRDLERKRRGVLRLVPLGVAPDGTCMGGKLEYGEFDRETIMGRIADHHFHGCRWAAMFPSLAVTAQAELDASMARAIKVLDDFDAAAEAESEASGLAAAKHACQMAYQSEERARLELLLWMPENGEQAAMKREYVMGCDLFDSILLDDGFVELMIDRLCSAAA